MSRHLVNLLLPIFLMAACGPEIPNSGGGLDLTFARQAIDGPCPETPEQSSSPPLLDRLEVTLYRSDGEIHYRSRIRPSAGAPAMAKSVPSGENLKLRVVGFEGDTASWSGHAEQIRIRAGKNTTASVFMTSIDDISCTRRPLHPPRAFAAGAELGNGRILLAGGVDRVTEGACGVGCREMLGSNAVDIFDPGSGFIFPAAALHTPRMLATATRLPDGSVLVVGGASRSVSPGDHGLPLSVAGDQVVNTFEVYLPEEDLWIEKPLADPTGQAAGRVYHTATALQDGKVLVAGGGTSFQSALDTALIFDPAGESVGDMLVVQSRMKSPRLGHAAVLLGDNSVLIIGGAVHSAAPVLEIFTPSESSGIFTSKQATGPEADLFFHGALAIPLRPDEVLVAGGSLFDGIDGLLPPSNGVHLLRGVSSLESEWIDAEPMNSVHFPNQLVVLGNDQILAAGGFVDLSLTPTQAIEEFDPASNAFLVPFSPSGPISLSLPRGGHAAVLVWGGRLLIAGGIGPDGLLGSAEIFTPEPTESTER